MSPHKEPGVCGFDVCVLLARLGERLINGREALLDALLRCLPVGHDARERGSGLAAPRALKVGELAVQARYFCLNTAD